MIEFCVTAKCSEGREKSHLILLRYLYSIRKYNYPTETEHNIPYYLALEYIFVYGYTFYKILFLINIIIILSILQMLKIYIFEKILHELCYSCCISLMYPLEI